MSYDYGATFVSVNSTGPQQWTGVADTGDGKDLLALTSTGSVYKSTDFGQTWTWASNITTNATGISFDFIAGSINLSSVYVTSRVGLIWKSMDGGLTWSSSGSPDGGSTLNWSSIDVSS